MQCVLFWTSDTACWQKNAGFVCDGSCGPHHIRCCKFNAVALFDRVREALRVRDLDAVASEGGRSLLR